MKATLKLIAAYLLLLLLTGLTNAAADVVVEVPGLPPWLPTLLRGLADTISVVSWIILLVVIGRLVYVWGPRLWTWMSSPAGEENSSASIEAEESSPEPTESERVALLLDRLDANIDRLASEKAAEAVVAIEEQVGQLVSSVQMLSERGVTARRRLGELQGLADAIRGEDAGLLARAIGQASDRQVADLVRSMRDTGIGGNMQPVLLAVEELSGEAQRTAEEYDCLAAALITQVVALRRRLNNVQFGLDQAAAAGPLLLASKSLRSIEGDLSRFRLTTGQASSQPSALPW